MNRELRLVGIAVALGVAALVAAPAEAAVVTETFTFSAANFNSGNFPSSPPVDPVNGAVTLTFDPEADPGANNPLPPPTQTTITLGNINITVSPSALAFTVQGGVLSIGNRPGNGGSFSVPSNTDDFFVEFKDINTTPTFVVLDYSQTGLDPAATFQGTSGTVAVTVPTTGVAEPASLLLLSAGLGLLGLTRRRSRV